MKKQVLLVLAVLLIFPTLALASAGRLDAYGGHYDNKAGGYNVEKGPLAGKHYADQVEMLKELQKVQPGSVSADAMAKAEKKLAKRAGKAEKAAPATPAKVEKKAEKAEPAAAAPAKVEEKKAEKAQTKAEEKVEKKAEKAEKKAAEKPAAPAEQPKKP